MGFSFKITVAVAAYNEEPNIAALLENLSHQTVHADRDIVVVSDGSSDRTSAIVQEFIRSDASVRLITHPRRLGKAEAINSILNVAQGEVIVLVSGDTRPAFGSISSLLEVIATDPDVGLVWAWPKPIMPESKGLANLAWACYHLHQRFMTELDRKGELSHSAAELLAFRPGTIGKLPSDCVNDDDFLALAATRKGLKVRMARNVQTSFVYPKSIVEYVQQRKRWLFGHMQMKKMTGEFPQVLEFSLTARSKLVLNVLTKEVRERPRNLFYFCAALLLDIMAFGSVFLATFSNRRIGWKIIESTKTFPSEQKTGSA